MKKLFITALAFCLAGTAMALEHEPEPGFAWQGLFGFNVSNVSSTGYDARVGVKAGANMFFYLPQAHGTYLTTGVNWSMKGGKFPFEYTYGNEQLILTNGTFRNNLQYVEIPIHAGFHYNFNKQIGLYADVGPYFAVGVCGKAKSDIETDGYHNLSWHTHSFKKADDGFQRFDYGIGFRVGGEYNQHYSLIVGCDWGLADIYRDEYRDKWAQEALAAGDNNAVLGKAKNFCFTMTFGYRF